MDIIVGAFCMAATCVLGYWVGFTDARRFCRGAANRGEPPCHRTQEQQRTIEALRKRDAENVRTIAWLRLVCDRRQAELEGLRPPGPRTTEPPWDPEKEVEYE